MPGFWRKGRQSSVSQRLTCAGAGGQTDEGAWHNWALLLFCRLEQCVWRFKSALNFCSFKQMLKSCFKHLEMLLFEYWKCFYFVHLFLCWKLFTEGTLCSCLIVYFHQSVNIHMKPPGVISVQARKYNYISKRHLQHSSVLTKDLWLVQL